MSPAEDTSLRRDLTYLKLGLMVFMLKTVADEECVLTPEDKLGS